MIKFAQKIGMVVDGDFDEKSAELLLQKPGIDTIALDFIHQQAGIVDFASKKSAHTLSEIWNRFYMKISE